MGTVIVVGSANTEYVLAGVERLVPGCKATCSTITVDGVGGSAVNWTHWLRSCDVEVLPFCPIGTDDEGNRIANWLKGCRANSNNLDSEEGCQQYPGTTSQSCIIVERAARTVITRRGQCVARWASQLENRLEHGISSLKGKPFFGMLGHIPSDASALETTPKILDLLSRRGAAFVYANLGRAQYRHCYHQWKDAWGKIDWLQLDLEEARTFVSECLGCDECRDAVNWSDEDHGDASRPSLATIMRWFQVVQSRVVVTLSHAGALAVARDCPGQLFFSWPQLPASKVIDPTGAGDAFAAGMVYAMLRLAPCRSQSRIERCNSCRRPSSARMDCYRRALKFGSLLGVRACEAVGGTGARVNRAELAEQFNSLESQKGAEVFPLDESMQLLHMLDQL